jgi:hypothetical protein
MLTLGISLSAIVVSAAVGRPEVLMAMTGLVSLVMAVMGLRDDRALRAKGASRSEIGASNARYMGLVWVWAALGLLMTYFFLPTEWREWWHFFLATALVGVLCLFFATAMQRDADKGSVDDTMLKLGRLLTYGQLAGMLAVVAGLLIDPGKRFLDVGFPDWAANNIFFFGAVALAAISANAILSDRKGGA